MQEKVKSLAQSARGRHFVVYFRNREVERSFARAGLTGDLSTTQFDYLGVFSQNLNGSKTDYWQDREVTSTVRLRADGSARAHVHVLVKNDSPPYTLPEPDPRIGYTTRYLGTLVAIFLPRESNVAATLVNGRPETLHVHVPRVRTVTNRNSDQRSVLLDAGQSATLDARFHVDRAADVLDSRSMTYRLDVDPQDTVQPQVFHIRVVWPAGFSPTGALPDGWKATRDGASFDGPITTTQAWAIPITRS
jgi:hypothetical protein